MKKIYVISWCDEILYATSTKEEAQDLILSFIEEDIYDEFFDEIDRYGITPEEFYNDFKCHIPSEMNLEYYILRSYCLDYFIDEIPYYEN
jgi:hypothetical protein